MGWGMMVGEGLNDAPAMVSAGAGVDARAGGGAGLSLAPASANDATRAAADDTKLCYRGGL